MPIHTLPLSLNTNSLCESTKSDDQLSPKIGSNDDNSKEEPSEDSNIFQEEETRDYLMILMEMCSKKTLRHWLLEISERDKVI